MTIFIGNARNNTIDGTSSNDFIDGRGGNDLLNGLGGNDSIVGGNGRDTLSGGNGRDTLNGNSGADFLNGNNGADSLNGGSGRDFLDGGFGSDVLIGGIADDSLLGGNGSDRLIGVDLNSGLGEYEIDQLTGGAGSDTFVLGVDNDVFYVGEGNDDYALITDFNSARDSIELPAEPEPFPETFEVNEIGAGQTASDAQIIVGGSGTLDFITGRISNNNDVDVFQITLDGGTFSASTVNEASFDTQLFLFDEDGVLIDSNDDFGSSDQSTISLSSLDAGDYFLAISSFNNDPNTNLFDGFTGSGFSNGDYSIALTGVEASGYSLSTFPTGLPSGTAITFDNDLVAIVQGTTIPDVNSSLSFV